MFTYKKTAFVLLSTTCIWIEIPTHKGVNSFKIKVAKIQNTVILSGLKIRVDEKLWKMIVTMWGVKAKRFNVVLNKRANRTL